MARRGKVNELKVDLTNYDYFISGQSSIGKSVLSFELGKKITGNNEGSFIISIEKNLHLTILTVLYMIRQNLGLIWRTLKKI